MLPSSPKTTSIEHMTWNGQEHLWLLVSSRAHIPFLALERDYYVAVRAVDAAGNPVPFLATTSAPPPDLLEPIDPDGTRISLYGQHPFRGR